MSQTQTQVVATSQNNYYVVWLNTSNYTIASQEFSANGTSITGPTELANVGVAGGTFAAAVNSADGDLELAYTVPGSYSYYVSFTPNLTSESAEINLGDNITNPALTAIADGSSIISYDYQPQGFPPPILHIRN
jgi:hypothetical protein